jgi:serine phosphatase RsbU (regulator of sigma subunit)
MDNALDALPVVEWEVASRPLAGELLSGDTHVVASSAHQIIVGVIDGLGHGPEAAAAADAAAAAIVRHATQPLIDVAQCCHEELRNTRGVAMSIAAFAPEAQTMSWLGVGNVEGVLFRANERADSPRETLLARGGVVGYRLPALRVAVLPVCRDDVLVFATDGIKSAFSTESPLGLSVRNAADGLLARFAKQSDDALVLVVRYRGFAR